MIANLYKIQPTYIDSTSFERVEKLTKFLRRIITILKCRQEIVKKDLSSMAEKDPNENRIILRLQNIERGLTFLQQSSGATLNLHKEK